MKVYRVVPDCFLVRGKKLDTSNKVYMEGIYYKMGYTTFSLEERDYDFNDLQCENKQGKYFFLFAEDAVRNGQSLYNSFHRIITDLLLIEEYDIPEDIVMKNIGLGDYSRDIMSSFCIETFIEKENFGNQEISTDQIDEKEKLRFLVYAFKESLNRMKEYRYCLDVEDAIDYYSDVFKVDILSSTINDEQIEKVLLNSEIYSTYLKQYRKLILSPLITKKIIPLNLGFFHSVSGNLEEKINQYYQRLDVKCNFYSKEHEELKKEIVRNLEDKSKNKEIVRKLLNKMI